MLFKSLALATLAAAEVVQESSFRSEFLSKNDDSPLRCTSTDYAKWIGGALKGDSKAAFERSLGAGNIGVSSPKALDQRKSTERLHGQHASQQTRQRRRRTVLGNPLTNIQL